jgi:glycerate 2-kinase
MNPHRQLLIDSFLCAVKAVQAETVVRNHIPLPPVGTLYVIGAGKAAAAMAAVVERVLPATASLRGLVITRYGHGAATQRIEVIEAGHPLPDSTGVSACERIIELLSGAGGQDAVLALLSGGGSSLLTLPETGIGLSDIQTVTHTLLRSGAPISAINCVRKHVSRTLGGKLAAYCRTTVHVLIVSDVVGDDPAVIASGPFSPDPSTFADAIDILRAWNVAAPDAITGYLEAGLRGEHQDTPKPGASCFKQVKASIIARAGDALRAAQVYLEQHGLDVIVLADDFESEAKELGIEHARIALKHRALKSAGTRPLALLSGGETRVTVSGQGRGGRNSEYLLSLFLELAGRPGIYALAADTDGIDGTEQNAGAWIGPDTWQLAGKLNLDVAGYLAEHDAYRFFEAVDTLLVTGPTRTNVNDYRVILIT